MKLQEKSRQGSYVYRKYDRATTPYARVLRSLAVSELDKEQLRSVYEELDPVLLLSEIERIQNELWATAVKPDERIDADTQTAELEPIIPLRHKSDSGIKRKRGRPSTLDAVWPEVLQEREMKPTMSASDVFFFLNQRYPGRFKRTQMQTIAFRIARIENQSMDIVAHETTV